jgi:hypothetical protein
VEESINEAVGIHISVQLFLYRAPCGSLDAQKLAQQVMHARICDGANASDVLINLPRELFSSDARWRVSEECRHALRRERVPRVR